MKGPQFIRFFRPTIEVLQEIGGSGSVAEVIDLVIEKMNISEEEQAVTNKNGGSRVRNQIQWAKLHLVKTGYIDAPRRGMWNLTGKGLKMDASSLNELKTFKKARETSLAEPNEVENDTPTIDEDEVYEGKAIDYKIELINTLKSLSSNGFERMCQRLLREHGFQKVTISGRSGDGGSDRNGLLELNPFISFTELFQCKRYQGSVSASQVRDLRGTMMGSADKGIIITTGSFTVDAKKEARRDGVPPPIELVDRDKLVEMFERLELGLRPRKTYDIDVSFFEDFKE